MGRNKLLQIRLNDEEHELIKEKAEELGLDMSKYLRMMGLQGAPGWGWVRTITSSVYIYNEIKDTMLQYKFPGTLAVLDVTKAESNLFFEVTNCLRRFLGLNKILDITIHFLKIPKEKITIVEILSKLVTLKNAGFNISSLIIFDESDRFKKDLSKLAKEMKLGIIYINEEEKRI